jgi:ubiquinone/menaquinone biosynthesis C-methylase UbiE
VPRPADIPRTDRLVESLFRLWSGVYDLPLFQRLFYRRVHRAVLRVLDDAPVRNAYRVLDLGCGTAQLTADLAARFPGAHVVGLDLSADMLAVARRRLAGPSLLRANVYALPLADGVLDLVTSTISYHWYLEPARALAEVRRVLRPGGRFVLATMATRRFRLALAHQRLAPAADHLADLRAAGFAVTATVRVRPAVHIFGAEVPT